jgi:hypothetical protein
MSKQSTGSRLVQIGLDPELVERFTDFRVAHLNAAENYALAKAIEFFMEHRLKNNPDIRAEYEAARKRRRKK